MNKKDSEKTPKVSVLMPVHNCARYLDKAIRSIRAQTFADFEFVIVDDGSTDKSLKIIQKHAVIDSRIKVISRSNTGIVGALNDGLAECRGEFIARMDGDDVSMPMRFERQLAYFRTHPEVGLVGSWVKFIDSAGWPIFEYKTKESHSIIEEQLLKGNGGCLVHPSIMLHSHLLGEVGGYRKTAEYVEDFDLYLRLREITKFANIPQPLLEYRQHFCSINVTKSDPSRMDRKQTIYRELTGKNLDQKIIAVSRCETHRKWAEWASADGNYGTALKHTLFSLFLEPTKKHSWAFARYLVERCLNRNPSNEIRK